MSNPTCEPLANSWNARSWNLSWNRLERWCLDGTSVIRSRVRARLLSGLCLCPFAASKILVLRLSSPCRLTPTSFDSRFIWINPFQLMSVRIAANRGSTPLYHCGPLLVLEQPLSCLSVWIARMCGPVPLLQCVDRLSLWINLSRLLNVWIAKFCEWIRIF
jgi:hypothetical protein